MANYKEKTCKVCGKIFKPSSSTQKYCYECGIIKNKYYFKHKEECNYKHKQWISHNKEQQKIKRSEYYYNNIDREKERNKTFYNENKELFKNKSIKFKTLNPNYHKEYMKKWHTTHKEHERQYSREYRKNKYIKNIDFKLNIWCRNQLNRSIKNKTQKTFDILGYTTKQLKQRLEFQFKNGMSWDNYGTYWVIHHKKALYKFIFMKNDNIDYKQLKLANSLANLQPITIEEHKILHNNKY